MARRRSRRGHARLMTPVIAGSTPDMTGHREVRRARSALPAIRGIDTAPVYREPMMAQDPLPLERIRVLDLSGQVGSYGGRLLPDVSADVVKVELPAGDELRRQGPFTGRRSDGRA